MYVQRPRHGSDPPPCRDGLASRHPADGGKFDGVLGVLAGLEVLRSLDDAGIATEAPICLVNWTNEEGARFAPGEMGSEVFAGDVDAVSPCARTDADGIYRRGRAGSDRLSRHRTLPASAASAPCWNCTSNRGRCLRREHATIGVVVAAKGQIWFNGVVAGQESHAGTTPMPISARMRSSAFAEHSRSRSNASRRAEAPAGVGTIGVATSVRARATPFPADVRFSLEFRHSDRRASMPCTHGASMPRS